MQQATKIDEYYDLSDLKNVSLFTSRFSFGLFLLEYTEGFKH